MNVINNNYKNNNKHKKDKRPKMIFGLVIMIIGLGIYIFSMYSGITGKFSFMHIRLGQQMDVSPIWSIISSLSLLIIGLGFKEVFKRKHDFYMLFGISIAGLFTIIIAILYYFD